MRAFAPCPRAEKCHRLSARPHGQSSGVNGSAMACLIGWTAAERNGSMNTCNKVNTPMGMQPLDTEKVDLRSDDAPLEIYLIRHAETAWSRSGRYTSYTDLVLTSRGFAMARQLAKALRGIAFTLVLTSPSARARATGAAAGFTTTETDANLAEWHYGDFEGLRNAEIAKQQSSWNLWENGCPGGELPAAVSARADQLISRLLGCTGKVALFSHGHFGCALAARWIGLPILQGQHFSIDPASISVLSFARHHPQRRIICLWNA